ncbi:MAG: hypothetical protein EHM41_25150 [Chloroflexi bacterium]|nr:MAG: hypothetical protein EHM41_25150 [Chloroflexota bacterium]
MLAKISTLPRNIFTVFIQKQTYVNLLYLWVNIGFGFTYYIILQVCLSLSWGFIYPNIAILSSTSLDFETQLKLSGVILVGLLVIPSLFLIFQLPVVPEQALANLLLKESIRLDTAMWSKDSCFFRPWRLLISASPWKRFLYMVCKVPLGGISFFAFFNVFIPAAALFGMPLAYLVGFRNLIIGPWRFDSVEKVLAAFLSGILLVPVALHGMNLLAKISGLLAKTLLTTSKA